MREQLINIILGITGFFMFSLLQAFIINGVKECFNEGMILSGFSKCIERLLGKYWSKPIVGCIRCMASFWSAVIYWPFVLKLFGWNIYEVPIFVANMFTILVLNWLIYKKL